MEDSNNNGIPDNLEAASQMFFLIVVGLILAAIFSRIAGLFDGTVFEHSNLQAFWGLFASSYLPLIKIMSVALSVALIVFVVYVTRESNKIIDSERVKINSGKAAQGNIFGGTVEQDQSLETVSFQNKRWEKVLKLINSESPQDWKVAILEADIMLGEMLDKMGYRGDSIGEQLKQIEKSDFNNLDNAWEAHKIRNSIAHEGEEFLITGRESKRIISLFEQVFLEFKYI